jgi:hypothetical protein
MTSPCPETTPRASSARCAQPQNGGHRALATPALTRNSLVPSSHVVDNKGKNPVVEKIANPCGGPARRALAKLARRCSTTLSTTFVDKKKFANASPAYLSFLHGMTTSADKS